MAGVQLAPSVLLLAEQLDGRLVGAGARGARHEQHRAQRAKQHGTHGTMASIAIARGDTHTARCFASARALARVGGLLLSAADLFYSVSEFSVPE
jgi:hypothetical protein